MKLRAKTLGADLLTLEAQVGLILHWPHLEVQVLEPPQKEHLGNEHCDPG